MLCWWQLIIQLADGLKFEKTAVRAWLGGGILSRPQGRYQLLLNSGVLLASIAAKQLPNHPSELESRMKTTNLQHIANRIINMNIILKAVRDC